MKRTIETKKKNGSTTYEQVERNTAECIVGDVCGVGIVAFAVSMYFRFLELISK